MAEERKIIPRPDNKYCPSCGAIYQEGEKFCSQCGTDLSKQKSKAKSKNPDDPELLKKKKRKRKIIIIVIILVLFLLAGAALAWSYYSRQNKTDKEFEAQINSMWSEVVNKSNDFKDNLNNPSSDKDLVQLSDQSKEIENLCKSKISELDSINAPKGKNYDDSKNKLKTALEKYAEYMTQLRQNILDKDIAKIKVSEDFSKVQKYADSVRDAVNDFMKASSFVKSTLSEDVFNLSKLKDFVENWQNEATNKNQQKNQQQQEAQKAADKQAAEKTVTDFINSLPNSYGASDKWAEAQHIADQYWSSGSMNNFRSDYKFYFEGGAGVTYIGGQVISSESVSDTKYNIQAEERERFNPSGGEPSENRFLSYFIVEKSNNRWAITSHGRR